MRDSLPTRRAIVYASLAFMATTLLLGGCDGPSAATGSSAKPTSIAPTQLRPVASIQELMEAIVDPSADAVWDSVGVSLTKDGTVNHQPKDEEEWKQVRLHAVALVEATNLLMMEGRRLVPQGGKIADDGEEGVLSTETAEQLLKSEHATFVQFAEALHEVSERMLKAVDARQPAEMLAIGEQMDQVCETCHMTFWYPKAPLWKMSVSK